jgi:hypothetical protein
MISPYLSNYPSLDLLDLKFVKLISVLQLQTYIATSASEWN